MKTDSYDVIVVGGGAAGLSAALVLGRARRRVAVIDSGEPRNALASHMQGYLSRDGLPPAELLQLGRDEAARYGAEFVSGQVASVEPGFSLGLADSTTLGARRLLLATGATDVLPEIPGARERWGRDFLHCPYCHGWEVRDRPLGVLSTGPGSVESTPTFSGSGQVIWSSSPTPTISQRSSANSSKQLASVSSMARCNSS